MAQVNPAEGNKTPESTQLMKRRIAGKIHRGTQALNYILTMSPSLLSFSMFVDHGDDQREANWPGSVESDIWNDGKRIRYAPQFEKREIRNKIAVVIKHLMKIALCHTQRARRLKRLMGSLFEDRLYVLSSDLVIHQSFVNDKQQKYEKLTPTLDQVIQRYTQWAKSVSLPDPKLKPAQAWSVEDSYHFLSRWREQMKEKAAELGIGADDEAWLQALLDAVSIDIDWSSQEAMQGQNDDAVQGKDDEDMLRWRNRFEAAKAGDRPGGVLRNISGDIPTLKTPWKQILRANTLRAVTRLPSNDWNRPSRRYISMMYASPLKGQPLAFEPARSTARAAPKIAICVDTSGSIDQATLDIFASAMNGIQKAKRTQLRLIIGDTQVEEIVDVRPDQLRDVCRKVQFKGQGGTDFRPLIASAVEWKPDIIVYLTDLAGTFPDKAPKCEMIWAVIPIGGMNAEAEAPWGKVIRLE